MIVFNSCNYCTYSWSALGAWPAYGVRIGSISMTSSGQSLQILYPRLRMNGGSVTKCSISAQSVGYLCQTTVASQRISAGLTTGNFCTAYNRTLYGRYSRSLPCGASNVRAIFWALDKTCPKMTRQKITNSFFILSI